MPPTTSSSISPLKSPRVTVAIDGPSGSGKSTVARELARRHGWGLVDTGAMYRALTWLVIRDGIDASDAQAVADLARGFALELGTTPDDRTVRVDGIDVTEAIRSEQVTSMVSTVSAIADVRAELVRRQREFANEGSVVMEGRDIGSVVLPEATAKVFLTASTGARSARRSKETGESADVVADALLRRDDRDSTRTVSPLAAAAGSTVIDSTDMTVDEVVDAIDRLIEGNTDNEQSAPARDLSERRAVPLSVVAPLIAGTGSQGSLRLLTHEGPVLYVVRHTARLLVRLILRVRVIGEERVPAGPVIVAGNHTGFLDGPLVFIMMRRPCTFLAKSELFSGVWASTLRAVYQVPVHRGEPDRNALHTAVETLNVGGVVAMFPEGTRGQGKLETIQDGVGYIAARTGATVIPVVCNGTAEALPKGRVFPRWRTPVDIIFGEPFNVPQTDPPRRSDMHAGADLIARELRALIDRAESRRPGAA